MNYSELFNKEITFIERDIAEDILLSAEQLIDANAINGQKYSNHWNLTVKDSNFHYQVSATINEKTIKSYQCNCNEFLKGKLCAHVAASIIFLRRDLSNEEVKTKKKKSLRKVKDLLNGLKQEELVDVITDYSRSNAEFRLQLYALNYDRLAPHEQVTLIEKSYPIHTKDEQRVTPKAANNFLMISQHLSQHLSHYIRIEDVLEAYNLILPLLKKSFYIKSKLTKAHKNLLLNHESLLKYYREVMTNIEAPEFKLSVIDQTFELLSSSYISADTPAEQELWLHTLKNKNHLDRISLIIKSYLSKGKSQDLSSYYFIKSLGLIIDQSTRNLSISHIDRQESYRIILVLLNYSSLPGVEDVMKEFLIQRKVNFFIAKQITQNITVQIEEQILIEAILQLYIESGDADFLFYLRNNNKQVDSMQSTIDDFFQSLPEPAHQIQYFIIIDVYDKAIETLTKSPDIALLNKFAKSLKQTHHKEIVALYTDLCNDYMQHHFGPVSREYLSRIYMHLDAINASKIKDDLIENLKKRRKKESGKVIV